MVSRRWGRPTRGSTLAMPKTVDKRADARPMARGGQAHQAVQQAPARPVARRAPAAPRRPQPRTRGPLAVIRDYPWATTIFVLLIAGVLLLILHQQQVWIWTPNAKPTATCNLKTHVCTRA